MQKHIHLEVEHNYVKGREMYIVHLLQNLAKTLHYSDEFYKQYLIWNEQFEGNGTIYLVRGLVKDGSNYYFTIRIGNNYFDAYTLKTHWFSYRDQTNRLINKSDTTICKVIPSFYQQILYKRPIQNEEMNCNKRQKCNSSISTNDINAIHELLSKVRQQEKFHMQNQIYSSNQIPHKNSSKTENEHILNNSLPTKR